MAEKVLEVSVIIPTAERSDVLHRTLVSLLEQTHWPSEIIIIDASRKFTPLSPLDFPVTLIHESAVIRGAAHQRTQGLGKAKSSVIWFLDDDVLLEQDCTIRLFNGIQSSDQVGAVSAMITNQRYERPGFLSRWMYILMSDERRDSYAGKVLGPAWNLLPEDDPRLPEYVPCEWLNTTCTMYRRSALPSPVFSNFFEGYSMYEDVALSWQIGVNYQLFNARTARIYHDSQPGIHKNSLFRLSEMGLVNRYWVMTRIMGREALRYKFKLLLLEVFGLLSTLRTRVGLISWPVIFLGKCSGLLKLIRLGRTV